MIPWQTLLIVAMAIIVEALVEYSKSITKAFTKDAWKTAVTQITAMAMAIALCMAANADLLGVLGLEFSLPWIGTVLTGIFASRGSNYVSDLIKKMQTAGGKNNV